MATVYKLVMNFLDSDGRTVTHTLKSAKPQPNASDVKAALNAFVTNGSIFKRVPVSKKSAYIVSTDQTEFAVE